MLFFAAAGGKNVKKYIKTNFLRNCEFCRFALAILCGCSYNMLHAKQLNDKQFAVQQ